MIVWAVFAYLLTAASEAIGQDGPFGKKSNDKSQVEFTAEFSVKTGTRSGSVRLIAKVAPSHHIYSVTQPDGGPIRSRISLANSDKVKLAGDFAPDSPPKIDSSKDIFDVNVEYHKGTVIWSAPIEISEGVEIEKLQIDLVYAGQVCEVNSSGMTIGCQNYKDLKQTASFKGFDANLKVVEKAPEIPQLDFETPFQPPGSGVTLSAKIVLPVGKNEISPGDKLKLEISAKPDNGLHVYAHSEEEIEDVSSTLFLIQGASGWKISLPQASVKPYVNKEMGYSAHKEPVTWTFEIDVPQDATKGDHKIDGMIGFQTCTDSSCNPPSGLKFSCLVPVDSANAKPRLFREEKPVSYGSVKKAKKAAVENSGNASPNKSDKGTSGAETGTSEKGNVKNAEPTEELIAAMAAKYDSKIPIDYILDSEMSQYPVGTYTPGAGKKNRKPMTLYAALVGMFLGGMILNLMPCVFPVLGLKVMGFVEQSGSDPKKIRMHGIVFSLGLLVAMWVLAGTILTLKLAFGQNVSWGAEQMGNPYFVLAITILMFLLALNMAGVFEFGTTLTRVGGGVDASKGYGSSFVTGILTTLVATPCSGPFLGAAMGYTFAQTAQVAMLLFTVFGLGIAFPYLVLTFFPKLIGFLPRPGAWMHTFKILMAFALFAAVAWFMGIFGGQTGVEGLVWLIWSLVVIALAAFFYGTWSPAFVQPVKRLVFGWLLPLCIGGAGVWVGCKATAFENTAIGNKVAGGVNWEKWHPGKIEHSLAEKPKFIWADYTAAWCPTCLFNKKVIFSNEDVLKKLEELDVELVKVDFTDEDEAIKIDLQRSDQSVIPVNIVYPPNYPQEPAILLDGLIGSSRALKVLERMEQIQAHMKLKQSESKQSALITQPAGEKIVKTQLTWEKWYPGKVEHSLSEKPKFIWADYTAAWNVTCMFNKKVIFSNKDVLKKLEELEFELVKVDLTHEDEAIKIDLQRSDQVSVPVNIIYPPNYPQEPAILLDGLIGPDRALKVLERMEQIQAYLKLKQSESKQSAQITQPAGEKIVMTR